MMMLRTICAALLALGFVGVRSATAGVDVHIGIPAPPTIVIEAPPRLVVVPGAPTVHYAPDVPYSYFSYGDQYYTYHSGNWFVARAYGGPWTYVERIHVPRPILGVPNRYYRDARHAGDGRRGHPHGMPPGQAKKQHKHHKHHDHD